MPVQEPLALVRRRAGGGQRLLGEVSELSVRRQQRVAEKFLKGGDRLHRAALPALDARLLQEREQALETLQVRNGVLLSENRRGGDLIRRRARGPHDLEPFRLGTPAARRLFLVRRRALGQRSHRGRLLGVHLRLRELARRFSRLRRQGERLGCLVPNVREALGVPAAAAAAFGIVVARRSGSRAGVPRAPATRGEIPGPERLLLLLRAFLRFALAPRAPEDAAAARHLHRAAARASRGLESGRDEATFCIEPAAALLMEAAAALKRTPTGLRFPLLFRAEPSRDISSDDVARGHSGTRGSMSLRQKILGAAARWAAPAWTRQAACGLHPSGAASAAVDPPARRIPAGTMR